MSLKVDKSGNIKNVVVSGSLCEISNVEVSKRLHQWASIFETDSGNA